MDEVDRLLALVRRRDESFGKVVGAAVYDIVESNLNWKNTLNKLNTFNRQFNSWSRLPLGSGESDRLVERGSMSVDRRVDEALEVCRWLVARMDSEELAEYLGECHSFGLEMANDRCSERIAKRPIKRFVHRQPQVD